MPKHRLVDKQREILRRQLYGKEVIVTNQPNKQSPAAPNSFKLNDITRSGPADSTIAVENHNYLYKDLVRILFLSSLAISAQLILFWGINQNIVKLPF